MMENYNEYVEGWFNGCAYRYQLMTTYSSLFDVTHAIRSHEQHLCIVGKEGRNSKEEIFEVHIPMQLLSYGNENYNVEENIETERCCYATSDVFQICAVQNERKLITSEENIAGVAVYNLGPFSADILRGPHISRSEHLRPRFDFNGESTLLATTNKQNISLMKMNVGRCIYDFQLPPVEEVHALEPHFLTNSVCVICNKTSGVLHIRDLRFPATNQSSVLNYQSCQDGVWSMATPYKQTAGPQESNDMKCACSSTGGRFLAYDIRHPQKPYCSAEVRKVNQSLLGWDLSLQTANNFQRFSMADAIGQIYIYDMDDNNDLNLAFCHEGHLVNSENPQQGCLVQSHLFIDDKRVMSVDNHRTIQCWQFRPVEL